MPTGRTALYLQRSPSGFLPAGRLGHKEECGHDLHRAKRQVELLWPRPAFQKNGRLDILASEATDDRKWSIATNLAEWLAVHTNMWRVVSAHEKGGILRGIERQYQSKIPY